MSLFREPRSGVDAILMGALMLSVVLLILLLLPGCAGMKTMAEHWPVCDRCHR